MTNGDQLKVAYVEPVGGHGGNDFYDFGLCKALAEQGTDLTFYTCDETDLDIKFSFPFKTKKTYYRIFGSAPKWIRGLRFIRAAFASAADSKKKGVNVVHLHIYHFDLKDFLNLFAFSRKGFHIVATIHDIESFEDFGQSVNSGKYLKFENRIDRIIVHSDYARKALKKYFPHFPEEKIHQVPHGDSDFLYNKPIDRFEARKKLNLPLDHKLLLFFGQIKKVKGLDVLLKAQAIIRDKMEGVKLLVVGRPWKVEQDEFDAIVKEKKLEPDCIFNYSFVENEIIPCYFAAADIAVLPYREIYSSGVMIRSLDYRSAIVASDLDTFKKIIVDGKNGVLFRTEDENDLAEKIIALLNDEGKMKQLRIEAKKTADEQFGWELIGHKVNEVYKLALHDK